MKRCGVWILALAGWVSLLAAPLRAHPADGRAVEVRGAQDGVELVVAADAARAAAAVGLGLEHDLDAIESRGELVTAWLARGLTVRSAGGTCDRESGPLRLVERAGATQVEHEVVFVCPEPLVDLELVDESLAGGDAHTVVMLEGRDGAQVLQPGAASMHLSKASRGSTALSFGREGIIHLLTGYDHLLFVLTLLLAAGLRAQREGTRRALGEAAGMVTAFTLGHSATLALAALDVMAPSAAIVEPAIAASIVVAALINLARPRANRARMALALAFGLIHGFGFSGVLAELGLPQSDRVLALLSFNAGIELAQLAFVAVALGPIAWLARRARYERHVLWPGSLAIAALGAVWLFERVAGA